MGTRREGELGFDAEAYPQSQRFGGPSYGSDPDAVGARYDDLGGENDGDDFGSARARGEAERVAWARPGSYNEEHDLDEWEDRANELGNDRSFRRRR